MATKLEVLAFLESIGNAILGSWVAVEDESSPYHNMVGTVMSRTTDDCKCGLDMVTLGVKLHGHDEVVSFRPDQVFPTDIPAREYWCRRQLEARAFLERSIEELVLRWQLASREAAVVLAEGAAAIEESHAQLIERMTTELQDLINKHR